MRCEPCESTPRRSASTSSSATVAARSAETPSPSRVPVSNDRSCVALTRTDCSTSASSVRSDPGVSLSVAYRQRGSTWASGSAEAGPNWLSRGRGPSAVAALERRRPPLAEGGDRLEVVGAAEGDGFHGEGHLIDPVDPLLQLLVDQRLVE